MQSVRNALRVLEEVSVLQPVGVSELARRLDLPKSTVQRALTTLHAAGWLAVHGRGTGGRWALAAKPALVGQRSESNRLRLAAEPIMQALRAETHETIHLMVPEGDEIVLIERIDGSLPVRTFQRLGTRSPIAATGNGKAMLAHLPQARVEALLADGLTRYTAKTITDPEALRAALALIRERGYATNRGEVDPDVSSVAAAIVSTGGLLGSISISVPTHRLDDAAVARLGPVVAAAAAAIEGALELPDIDASPGTAALPTTEPRPMGTPTKETHGPADRH
ncbi:MAG: helix-turn-helix domain-containing protein [Acidimicrobiia bacterium]|nr:helix-turn-helix domain-containing protein [Acidimicrobiia bacterium]